ncbi:hypothetical protein VNO78_21565 [Psophocarpus tetragonolobus]|uniref:Uncharacterized protein n=1 Tax=Psophocarpus tetragonolobus TaxID=3891 RepID=A0AAN9XIB9_PSOTE
MHARALRRKDAFRGERPWGDTVCDPWISDRETVSKLRVSVAGHFVNRGRFLVTTPGDIKSKNADMSNEKSCKKHDRLPVEGFLRSVNLHRVNRSLRKPRPRKGCRPMGTQKSRSCFDYRTMPVCWSELDDRAKGCSLFPSLSFP